ncbi:hypothetical protein KM176_21675 [Pseudooceanicola sp. CBS1P-1]|uniref:hypothetical protein n=1 Tax=Pseudooceanicola TaxID=1679449 RepID=UPI0019253C7C|nr:MULTISPECIES: hypothetical protein [Pseudooceanicola]MBT9386486.1 hypothetical protein [Pseudooceanicola endophyticus]
MSDRSPHEKGLQSREDRLKAALKANLGRRKAQARARKANESGEEDARDDKNKD